MLSTPLSHPLQKSTGADLAPCQLLDLAEVPEQWNYCLVGLPSPPPSLLKINMDQVTQIRTLGVCAVVGDWKTHRARIDESTVGQWYYEPLFFHRCSATSVLGKA